MSSILTAPSASHARAAAAPIGAACPEDAALVAEVGALRAGFLDALIPKPDGTRHHRNCLNRHVNASVIPCSDKCTDANRLLAERPQPEQRARFAEVAG